MNKITIDFTKCHECNTCEDMCSKKILDIGKKCRSKFEDAFGVEIYTKNCEDCSTCKCKYNAINIEKTDNVAEEIAVIF